MEQGFFLFLFFLFGRLDKLCYECGSMHENKSACEYHAASLEHSNISSLIKAMCFAECENFCLYHAR